MSSQTPTYEILVRRMEKIERENRRMKRAALALLILPLAFVLMAQSPATRTVEANQFVLKDASGHTRARLWFGEKPTKSPPTAYLTFYDSAGKRDVVSLSADGTHQSGSLNLGGITTDTPSVTLSANPSGSYASLGTSDNKLQGIQLSAESGTSRLSLSGKGDSANGGVNLADGADGGEIHVKDAKGNAGVNLLAKGNEAVSLTDRDGRSVLLVGDHLSFGDSEQSLRAVLYGGKDGPYLNLADAQGFNVQLGVSKTIVKTTGKQLTSSVATLRMFDPDGNIIWSAP